MIKTDPMKHYRHHLINNKKAVISLPMRLTVSIIIGTIALAFIITYITNPCLFPGKMIISINPWVNTITGDQPVDIEIMVNVTDAQGYPIENAQVIIKGLKGIGSNYTDKNGKTKINITVKIENNSYEGYLDTTVKAPCFETYSKNEMIKIVKQ